MDKLKKVIEEYQDWVELSTYITRIESHIEIDFSHSLENAKALLESVGKQICLINKVELGAKPSVNSVLKKCFSSMGFSNEALVNQVSSALATIAQQVGNWRNNNKPYWENKQHSDETKRKISETRKLRKIEPHNKGKILPKDHTCDFCGRSLSKQGYTRHIKICKNKNTNEQKS
jgi:hypothetical protein